MANMNRRDFFRVVGVTGTAGLVACDPKAPAEQIYPYVVQPENITPGIPTYYATVVDGSNGKESVFVKTVEGRAIFIEANPHLPASSVSPGGAASLQDTYDPDRVQAPTVAGQTASWDDALGKLADAIAASPTETVWLGQYQNGSLGALIGDFSQAIGAREVHWEPHGVAVLAKAAHAAWGSSQPPRYDMSKAEVIVSFGADFLHTWSDGSNHALGWKNARNKDNGPVAHFTAIEPRVSNTAAKADTWLSTRPGTEAGVALALAKLVSDEKGAPAQVKTWLSSVDAKANATAAGVPFEKLEALAQQIASKPSVVFPGGVSTQGPDAFELTLATLVLNHVAGNLGETVFPNGNNVGKVNTFAEVESALDGAAVIVVDGLDPVFSSPSASLKKHFDQAKLVAVIANSMPEDMPESAILLPPGTALEGWGDLQLSADTYALQQPAMRALHDTKSVGDIVLGLAQSAKVQAAFVEGTDGSAFAAADFHAYLKARWEAVHTASGSLAVFSTYWNEVLGKGVATVAADPEPEATLSAELPPIKTAKPVEGMALLLFSHQNLFDGRHANKAWLQEVPETLSGYTWGTWAELSPKAAKKLGVGRSSQVRVSTKAGEIVAGVSISPGMRDDAVAVVVGNGHKVGNRYSKDFGANPNILVNGVRDQATGEVAWAGTSATVKKAGGKNSMTKLNGHTDQDGRPLARSSYVKDVESTPDSAPTGSLAPGLGIPHDPRIPADEYDMYPEPEHPTYRFGMAIDLDSCTGCTACAVACASENNIPTVGPIQHRKNRYMGWVRMNAFWEGSGDNPDVRFMPVMCQQCSHAPCEGVCPVLATYHNLDGLNAMIYNRCVGTRYCANNCPYSARRFNYHTFRWPETYNLMLNPDVSTREMGVMEKCTFCVQRLRYAKATHRAKGIDVVPDEVLRTSVACAAACPTGAMTFGNLKDPESKVSKVAAGPRAYAMLDALNTKPGVRYLTKIVHTKPVDAHHGGHGGGHGDDHGDGHSDEHNSNDHH